MKKIVVFLCLQCLIGCSQLGVTPTPNSRKTNKWQPILLKSDEFFEYQTTSGDKVTIVDLLIKQGESNRLQALWDIKRQDKTIVSKQVLAPANNLLISSKAALITEKNAVPFVSTILLNWWSGIDYFRWEIGFKRAVLVDMLAGFMVEVIEECNVAGIEGFQVQLTTGKTLMAEACLAPNIAFPLSVKRYPFKKGSWQYEATLQNYRYQ